MKITATIIASILTTVTLQAQINQGTILYEKTTNMHRGVPAEFKRMINQFQTEEQQLVFNKTASFYSVAPKDELPDPFENQNGGEKTMKNAGINYNTQVYYNYIEKRSVESRELDGTQFLIINPFPASNWRISDETKTILGYKCRKAVKTIDAPEGGWTFKNLPAAEAKPATVEVVAWYTEDLLIPVGPDHFNALPGLILEVNVDNGAVVYTAKNFSKNAKDIKEPKKGKLVTLQEFKNQRSRIMKEKKVQI